MILRKKKTNHLRLQIDRIIKEALQLEEASAKELSLIHPLYKKSALNLIHYMAFRNFSLNKIQEELSSLGLPTLNNVEGHVMESLLAIKTILNFFNGCHQVETGKDIITIKKASHILDKNTKALFGFKSKKRRTRIMVTLPTTAATDKSLVRNLLLKGMNSARINCAHDNPKIWKLMISNIIEKSKNNKKACKIMMDLSGPKLRTGLMQPGPEVLCLKPRKNNVGVVEQPSRLWLSSDISNPPKNIDGAIPIKKQWLDFIKKGDLLKCIDSSGKNITINITSKCGDGYWAECFDSAYITSGTRFSLHKKNKQIKEIKIGCFTPIETYIDLNIGDSLILDKNPILGENGKYNEKGKLITLPHISCTLPEVFEDIQVGDPIFFDDGKIEGVIKNISKKKALIKIINASDRGGKLRQDKGINLPESKLRINGLTVKDKKDLPFINKWADVVSLSFVNSVEDVKELTEELKKLKSDLGIILKIETKKGYGNLPKILLQAMQSYPIGVMIARGDLAIETGWKNIATVQEEILRVCEAAHIPNILATQVLENLAKKGTPSRAEITDAAFAQRAECVMLNKGYHIQKAVKLLDIILKKMQYYHKKMETILPKLDNSNKLTL